MTQFSYPWPDNAVGDGQKYTDDQWSDAWRYMFIRDRSLQGVIEGVLNELAVSGTTSPVSIATGVGLDDGKMYTNNAIVQIAIPTPSASPRIDRIVLAKDWSAQTVRIARVAGSEGGGAPALTQTDGTLWQIPLAQVTIQTGGTLVCVDEREFVWTPMSKQHITPVTRYVEVVCFSFRDDETVVVGDGAGYLHIPADLAGMDLVEVHDEVKAAGTTGTSDVQIRNVTQAADMLSTKLTIDSGETGSDTAATPAVIDTANDDVAVNDLIRIDVDAVQTTPPEGLLVTLGFREPSLA